MRDDVKKLFDDLQTHLKQKTHYLNSLLQNGKQISYLIKKNNEENKILILFSQNDRLIDNIDIEDFHIAKIKDEMSRRYSFDFEKIFCDKQLCTENEIEQCKKEIINHKDLIREILEDNEQNYNDMNSLCEDLKQQITEIQRMSKIEIKYPGNDKL